MYHSVLYIVSIILWLYSYCCYGNQPVLEGQDPIADLIVLAEEYRVDKGLAGDVEQERELQVLHAFYSRLREYTLMDSLRSAVQQFVVDMLENDSLSIVDASQTNMHGRSKNSVFFVCDGEGLRYIVKAFPDPCLHPSEYLAEISALGMIRRLGLPKIAPVDPLGCAIYREDGHSWGLLLETAAKGKRLDEYLHPFTDPSLSFEEQEVAETVAKIAFSMLGQSLAQLHACNSSTEGPIPSWNLERYDDRVRDVLNNEVICKKLSAAMPIEAFVSYVEHVKNEVLAINIPYTYLHGDAHFGNMFCSEEDGLFYFIDTARLHRSVAYDGQPILDGTLDLLRVEENLKTLVVQGLPEDAANALLSTFYQSHKSEAGRGVDARLLDFYRTFMLLGRLIIYSRYGAEMNPSDKKVKKAIFKSAIKEFRSRVRGC